MLTNEQIDHLAVTRVAEVIAKAGCMLPQLNAGDKIPIWDGEITVYRNPGHFSNANYMASIPAQIKGHKKQTTPSELSYPVEINYLRAFAAKAHPTLFFVVTMNEDGENRTIFYRALYKSDWESLTPRQRNQGTVTIPFFRFPTDSEAVRKLIVDLAGGKIPDMPPIPLPLPLSPEKLFTYKANVTGFFGRDKELELLRGFLDDPSGFLWWGIAAPGGAGKSRLAYEFMNTLNAKGEWTAKFLEPGDYDQLDKIVGESPVPLLLISDYAQLHAAPLGKWMERQARKTYNMPTLRLLLLDRDDGEEGGEYPWEKQIYREGDRRYLREARYQKIMPLGKLEDQPLCELIRDFADELHRRDGELPPLPDGKENDLLKKLQGIDEGLSRPLFALILTDAYLRDPAAEKWSREKLLENLVEREQEQYRHAIRNLRGTDNSDEALEALCLRLKCVATALGTAGDLTLSQMEAACAEDWQTLKGKAGQYNFDAPDALLQNLGLLAIRGEELFVSALRPDLLGEYMVLYFLKHCGRAERARRNLFFQGILSADVYPVTFYQRLFRDYRHFLNANPSLPEKLLPAGLALNDEQAAAYSALLCDGFDAAPDLASRERMLGVMEALLPENRDKSFFARIKQLMKRLLPGIRDESQASTLYHNLARIYWQMGRFDHAQSYNERALAILEKRLGSEHPDVAASCNNLGNVLYLKGDLDGAMAYHKRALAIREKRLGSEHPDVAQSYDNLGAVLADKGDLDGAMAYHERALAIREKRLGSEHPDVARSCNNLGRVLCDKGDLDGAMAYLERALAIREKQLGSEHPDVARSCNNLGEVLRAKGDLDGAMAYHERALAIREKRLGSEHPDVAACYNNLGMVLCDKGDFDDAIAYLKRAQAILEKYFDANHPNVKTVRENIEFVSNLQAKKRQ